MTQVIENNEIHTWYDSLEEMTVETDRAIAAGPNRLRWSEVLSDRYALTRFNGCGDQRLAMKRCLEGWPELLSVVNFLVEELKKEVNLAEVEAVAIATRRRKRTRSDYGDTLDMHRVWGGQLDRAWERPTRRDVLTPSQRYATIYVDLAMTMDVSFNDTLWRAAAAYCIIEVLTNMGINTEVWCGSSHANQFMFEGPKRSWKAVRVKEYTQPLNDERLAAMVSAAFHRTFGWKMIVAQPFKVDHGFGQPWQVGFVMPLRERVENGERVFRIGNCFSKGAAVRDLNNALEVLKTYSKDRAA